MIPMSASRVMYGVNANIDEFTLNTVNKDGKTIEFYGEKAVTILNKILSCDCRLNDWTSDIVSEFEPDWVDEE